MEFQHILNKIQITYHGLSAYVTCPLAYFLILSYHTLDTFSLVFLQRTHFSGFLHFLFSIPGIFLSSDLYMANSITSSFNVVHLDFLSLKSVLYLVTAIY